jgi:hypothetical protein
MKSSWIGIGFSHHNVPSLSNTARRSAAGIAPEAWTNSTIARFAVPSRQLGKEPCSAFVTAGRRCSCCVAIESSKLVAS